MKSMWLFGGVLVGLLTYQVYDHWIHEYRSKCLFYRHNVCVTCDEPDAFPVGYQTNCSMCPNREAVYVDEGLFPAWQCRLKTTDENAELPDVTISSEKCPSHHPLRDIWGNCYSCDTNVVVQVAHWDDKSVCAKGRFGVPDHVVTKSVKCPALSDVKDPDVCVACGGVVWDGKCFAEGENHFCAINEDCPASEWCYPLRVVSHHAGVCAKRPENHWYCSDLDGYDLNSATMLCDRLGMKIPTLDDIEHASEDLSALCPTLDIWTFFAPDGVVWLESFTQEFLFTREGEADQLGGHSFHALCHKD